MTDSPRWHPPGHDRLAEVCPHCGTVKWVDEACTHQERSARRGQYVLLGVDGRMETSSRTPPQPRYVGDVLYELEPDRTLKWNGHTWVNLPAEWTVDP